MTAYLLTGNPSYWPEGSPTRESLEQDAFDFRSGHALGTGWWSTRRTTGYEPGDRIYLLLQGAGPKGIVASGHVITGEVFTEEHFADATKTSNYLDVDWDATVDFDDVLPTEELKVLAPSTQWRTQTNGTAVAESDEIALEAAWRDHLVDLGYPRPGAKGGGTLGGKGGGEPRPRRRVVIPTGYTMALSKVRKHQAAFRKLLLVHYPHECAACGLDVVEVLEAAHLIADRDGGEASTANGRLLCPNHHRAFDKKLLTFDRRTGTFHQAPKAPHVAPQLGVG